MSVHVKRDAVMRGHEGEVMMRRMTRALLPGVWLQSAMLTVLLSGSGTVQAQSALETIEGSWSDLNYGCERPWRITASGDTILFELPFPRSSPVSYYSTTEKVTGSRDNIIDTVTTSMSSDDVFDIIGGRFTYTLDGDSVFIMRDHRTGADYRFERCKGRPVASRDGATSDG